MRGKALPASADRDLLELKVGHFAPEGSWIAVALPLDRLLPIDLVDEGRVPVFPMDRDKSFHVLASPLDPRPPAVEVGLVADDDRYAAILALVVDRDVGFALEWVETEGLGHLDKLELLLLGELAGEAEG